MADVVRYIVLDGQTLGPFTPDSLRQLATDGTLRPTDLVFDGTRGRYGESDVCNPQGVYGQSKRACELAMLQASDRNLIIRTAAFFGPWDRHNFAWHMLQSLKRGERVEASSDVYVSPTYVPDLCHALLDLLIDGAGGLWHLANPGRISWYDFALRLAQAAGVDSSNLFATSGQASDTSLISEHGALLRPIDAAIAEYCASLAAIEDRLAREGFLSGGHDLGFVARDRSRRIAVDGSLVPPASVARRGASPAHTA